MIKKITTISKQKDSTINGKPLIDLISDSSISANKVVVNTESSSDKK